MVILESNDSLPDTHYHGSHGSHCSHSSHVSHASHFSAYTISTDSINSISNDTFGTLKSLLRQHNGVELYRAYLSNSNYKTDYSNYTEPTLVLVCRNEEFERNYWICVTLNDKLQVFDCGISSPYDKRNNIEGIYGAIPSAMHRHYLSEQIISFIRDCILSKK